MIDVDLVLQKALDHNGEMTLEFAGEVIGGPKGRRGLPGKDGRDGETPTFTIGTVETLPGGATPVVEVGGTAPDYVLNFKLPRGVNGDKGDPGLPGTGTATVYRSTDMPDPSTGADGDIWFVLK